MDFDKAIGGSRAYNFHSHTEFCDGRAPMIEMARAAVAGGFTSYGFTPHSPIPIPSPCNMSADKVADYLAEVERIRQLPELSSCRFFAGMEVDYLGPDWGPANPYFHSLGLDYTIGSVHFIPSQSGEPVDVDGNFENFKRKMRDHFRGEIDYVVETFYNQSKAMIMSGGFDILGHFDKVGQNANYFAPGIEDGSHYRSRVDEIIQLIIDKNLVIELNTKARGDHNRFFPGERYLPRLVRAGVKILVNSDAHYPDRIAAGREEAFGILDSIQAL